jgi:hypothetical protein
LEDTDTGVGSPQSYIAALQLTEHLLRFGCRRCSPMVEIQKLDAIRLYSVPLSQSCIVASVEPEIRLKRSLKPRLKND